LLQRILYGHPKIQTSAETWLMLHPCYSLKENGISTEYDSHFAALGTKEFIENYTDGFEVYDDAIRQWAKVIYTNAINKHNKEYFLDKTPRYFFIIEDLYRLFPKAKFIFLLRNPMAILASELKTYIKGDWPVLSVFRPDLVEAPNLIIKGIKQVGDDAHVVKYEELVSNPETEVKNICKYLEMPFHQGMIEYSQTPVPKGVMNDQAGIHKYTKPSISSIDRWKLMADDPQNMHFAIAYLETLGPRLIEKIGYDYKEIYNYLVSNSVKKSSRLIYPWSRAICPKEELTLWERFLSRRYFYIRLNGKIIGNFKAGINGIMRMFVYFKRKISST